MKLENEADLPIAQGRLFVFPQPKDVNPVKITLPLVGWSRVPSMCSSVLFPAPDCPTMATVSPASTCRSRVNQNVDRLAVAVPFAEFDSLDQRLGHAFSLRTESHPPSEAGRLPGGIDVASRQINREAAVTARKYSGYIFTGRVFT